MVRSFVGEEWRVIPLPGVSCKKKYAVSNFGRIVSYSVSMKEDGLLLKLQDIKGYPMINNKHIRNFHEGYVHKLVASFFCPKGSKEHKYVLHKDYNKKNNNYQNLIWATKEEMLKHYEKNPNVIKARKEQRGRTVYKGHKLTEAQVRLLKKKIMDPNRKTRLKIIARQFGISEMQLYRIKSGENWGHVTIDQNKPCKENSSVLQNRKE
jgi:hypothetical protein